MVVALLLLPGKLRKNQARDHLKLLLTCPSSGGEVVITLLLLPGKLRLPSPRFPPLLCREAHSGERKLVSKGIAKLQQLSFGASQHRQAWPRQHAHGLLFHTPIQIRSSHYHSARGSFAGKPKRHWQLVLPSLAAYHGLICKASCSRVTILP